MYVQMRIAKRSVQPKNCSNSVFEPHNTIHMKQKTSAEDTIPEDQEVFMAQDIVDGPCLIPNMGTFLEQLGKSNMNNYI